MHVGTQRQLKPSAEMRFFSRRYRMISYAARGYAPSDIPTSMEAYSQRIAVDDALAVLDALKIPKAHVVGMSMGGFTTVHLGLIAPERALSLTVAGAGYGCEKEFEDYFRGVSLEVADNFEKKRVRKSFPRSMHSARAGFSSRTRIRAATDAKGLTADAEIDRLLAVFPSLPTRPFGFPLHAYVEPHVLLEQAGCTIGVVTGIQGKKTFEVTIEGARGHAGTLAMAERRDAVVAFASVMMMLQKEIGARDSEIKFTVGRVDVEPNAPSVVAGRVRFRIDLRHPHNAILDRCGARLSSICSEYSAPCMATVTPLVCALSNDFDPGLRAMIAASAARRAIPAMDVLSYAGHDARQLATLCPSAMIFIPCRDGISHDESEWAEPDHVTAGAQVLLDVVCQLGVTRKL